VRRRRPTWHVGACSLRGPRALFAGIQKVEIASGEILLFPQALGHARAHERPARDPSEHVVVPREQLAQLRADVRLRELRRHLPSLRTLPKAALTSRSSERFASRPTPGVWLGLLAQPPPLADLRHGARHGGNSTPLRRGRRLTGVDWFPLALRPEPRPKARRPPTRVDARGDEPRRTGFDLQGQHFVVPSWLRGERHSSKSHRRVDRAGVASVRAGSWEAS